MKYSYLIFRVLILAAFAFLTGCSTSKKLNLYEGTFQVIKPPHLTGNHRSLDEKHNMYVSADLNLGHNKTKKLYELKEKHKKYTDFNGQPLDVPDSNLNAAYRLVQTIFEANFLYSHKLGSFFVGGNAGFAPFPYVAPSAGINTEFFEIGVSPLLGFGVNDVSVSGFALRDRLFSEDTLVTGTSEGNYFQVYTSFNAFLSFYFEDFAVTYSGAIAYPWGAETIHGYDVPFDFPYIIQQNVEFGYLFRKKYDARVGVTQITGEHIGGRTYSANVKFGYVF
ncbi:MAG: hypothetical protein LBR60_03430 [Fibrobacter sp.]|nr:hypothetical protein [Fibrobacter sp.]